VNQSLKLLQVQVDSRQGHCNVRDKVNLDMDLTLNVRDLITAPLSIMFSVRTSEYGRQFD